LIEFFMSAKRNGYILDRSRKDVCSLLQTAGQLLNLPQLTIATGTFYFHRFFTNPDSQGSDNFITGVACLFLASKVEETPKKLRDVIVRCYQQQNNKELHPDELDDLKKSVLRYEQTILNRIGFDLTVEHPHATLLKNVKLISSYHTQPENKELAQIAWNIVNDSLKSTLCLHFRPHLIANAALYLASMFLQIPLIPDSNNGWCTLFGVNFKDIESIASLLLALYPGGMHDIRRDDPSGTRDLKRKHNDLKSQKCHSERDEKRPRLSNAQVVQPKISQELECGEVDPSEQELDRDMVFFEKNKLTLVCD